MVDFRSRKKKRMVERLESKLKNSPDISKANKEVIAEFTRYCKAQDLSPSIMIHNMRIIGMLAIFLKKAYKNARKQDIEDFCIGLREGMRLRNETFLTEKGTYLEQFGPYKQSSLNTYNAVVKKFYRWLYGLPKDEDPEITEWIRTREKTNNRKLPEDLLTAAEVKSIVEAATDPRDKAMMMVLYESGCRCGELLSLRVKSVRFDDYGAQIVVDGKTGMRRIRLIDAIPELRMWLNHHPLKDDPDAPLWINLKYSNFQALGPAGVERTIRKLAKRAGITKRIHPHLFRHSRFTELAQHFTESELRLLGGWSGRSDMIETYVHLAGRDIDKKMLELKGVAIDKRDLSSPLEARKCPRCEEVNPHSARFCNRCTLPLDPKAAMELEEQREKERKLHEKLHSLTVDKRDVSAAKSIRDVMFEVLKQDKNLVKELKEMLAK